MNHRWNYVSINDLAKEVSREIEVDGSKSYKLLGIRWYNKGLFLKDEKNGHQIQATRLYQVRKGDFIYNRLFAWRGSFAMVPEEYDGYYVSGEFPCFIIGDKLDPNYLCLFFAQENVWSEVHYRSSGLSSLSRFRLKVEQFLQMKIPVPSLNEQKLIVKQIGELTTRQERIMTLKGEVSTMCSMFRQGVLAKAFRGELTQRDPNDEPAEKLLERIRQERKRRWEDELRAKGKDLSKHKYQEPEPLNTEGLQELPEGWVWRRLTEIIEDVKHYNPSQNPQKPFRYVDISSIDNQIIVDHKTYLGVDAPSRARKPIRTGDVLFSTVRTNLRNVAVVPPELDEEICSTGFCVIRCIRERAEPEYVFYYMLTDHFTNTISSMGRGGHYPAVREKDVLAQLIPLPSLTEQRRIVARCKDLFSYVGQTETTVEMTRASGNMLEQAILAKAFKGELVPQDPNDEPTSVLMEKIRTEGGIKS